MIDRLKKWIEQAVDGFLRGVRGEASPVAGGKPAGKGLLILRDGIGAFTELVLTAAAIFTFIHVVSLLVKIILAIIIVISSLRTYTASRRFLDSLF